MEAFAATRVVTEQLVRHGLKRTVVLQKDGRATGPEQTYRFSLTDAEIAAGSVVKGRRLAKGIDAHVDNVRAIAQSVRDQGQEVDEEAMLAELANAVPEFLEQFREKEGLDPDAELAQDVGRVATWLANPARRFELSRVLAGAAHLELDYSCETGEMSHIGRDAVDYAYGIMPWVPIRLRTVAKAAAVVFVRDPEELAHEATLKVQGGFFFFPSPKLVEVGRESLIACQRIGLGVVRDRARNLAMTFTLDPVFYAGTSFRDDDDAAGGKLPKTLRCSGIPQTDPEIASDGIHYVGRDGTLNVQCPEFLSYLRRIEADDIPGSFHEAIYARRFMPVTAETCRLLLSGGDRDDITVWRWFADLVEETVLPESVLADDGTESWMYRDRFAEVLYRAGEKGLAGFLESEARNRADAYEAYVMRTATGARRRKLDFRQRMRG